MDIHSIISFFIATLIILVALVNMVLSMVAHTCGRIAVDAGNRTEIDRWRKRIALHAKASVVIAIIAVINLAYSLMF